MQKRIHARICIVLSLAALILWLLGSTIAFINQTLGIVAICLMFALFVAAIVVRIIFLRCKSCGITMARLQWSSNREFFCSRCGEQFKYDK